MDKIRQDVFKHSHLRIKDGKMQLSPRGTGKYLRNRKIFIALFLI